MLSWCCEEEKIHVFKELDSPALILSSVFPRSRTETAIQYTELISDSISTRAVSDLPLLIYLVHEA